MYIRRYDWHVDDREATVYLSRSFRVRITDTAMNPIPFAKCRIADNPEVVFECDENGIARIPADQVGPTGVVLEWGPADADDEEKRFCWSRSIQGGIQSTDDDDCRTRLDHLGFHGEELSDQVAAYQTQFQQEVTGNLADIREDLAGWHDGGTYPGL
jgi:hypothetical protein